MHAHCSEEVVEGGLSLANIHQVTLLAAKCQDQVLIKGSVVTHCFSRSIYGFSVQDPFLCKPPTLFIAYHTLHLCLLMGGFDRREELQIGKV